MNQRLERDTARPANGAPAPTKVVALVYSDGTVSLYADQPGLQVRVVEMEPPAEWAAPGHPRALIRGDEWEAEGIIHDYDDEVGVDAPFVAGVFANPAQ